MNDNTTPTLTAPETLQTDEVTDALETYDAIHTADTWTESGHPGDNTYALTYDTDSLSTDDVTSLLSEMLESIEYYHFTVRDHTHLYADHNYTLILSVTFQLS